MPQGWFFQQRSGYPIDLLMEIQQDFVSASVADPVMAAAAWQGGEFCGIVGSLSASHAPTSAPFSCAYYLLESRPGPRPPAFSHGGAFLFHESDAPLATVTTNALEWGLGGTWNVWDVAGAWSLTEATLHINVLETQVVMRVIRLWSAQTTPARCCTSTGMGAPSQAPSVGAFGTFFFAASPYR